MKARYKKIIYLLITMGLSVCVGCDKFLDVDPQGKITSDKFWSTGSQALGAIGGMYSNLGCSRDNWTAGAVNPASATFLTPMEAYIYWGEVRGETVSTNPGKTPANQIVKENVDNYLVQSGDMTTQFRAFYKIINEANQIISRVGDIPAKDPSFTDQMARQYIAEGYFVRAFCHFWLARTFKEVPLVLDPSERDDQTYNLPKSTQMELFNQITNDLNQAKADLPETYADPRYKTVRATRYTAAAMLADVYLWMAATTTDAAAMDGYYQHAIENCDEVINSNKYQLLPGSRYADLFIEGGTLESIFETFGDASLNGQGTSMQFWFNSGTQYWVVNTVTDNLFADLTGGESADYRSAVPPRGPSPAVGQVVSYNASSRQIMKYNNNSARWIFYRYPDVFFMKAEALGHRNPDDPAQLSAALNLIQKVRTRAFGLEELVPVVTVSSISDLDNLLLDERAREFLGEGKRWFDLVRFASRKESDMNSRLLIDRVLSSLSGSNQLVVAPRVTNPESWYFPLNADELAANPSLVQNPYYE